MKRCILISWDVFLTILTIPFLIVGATSVWLFEQIYKDLP